MRYTLTLELCLCLLQLPVTDEEVAKVNVDRLSDEGVGADCAVAGVKSAVFAIPLVEDDSMSLVHLFNRSKFNIRKNTIGDKFKVMKSCLTTA